MITKNRYENGQEGWLALRAKLRAEGRLGGSEVGTAAGLNPWKSPLRLWAEMTGVLPEPDLNQKESVRVGHDMEEYVAKRFSERSGKTVHRENCVYTNDACPHLFGTIDRKVENEESGLECKTASALRRDAFPVDAFPEAYYAQCLTYLAVTGLKRWYLAVWVMGAFFRTYLITTVPEDADARPDWLDHVLVVAPEEVAKAEEIAAGFVAKVQAGERPAYVGSDDEREAEQEMNPPSDDTDTDLTGDAPVLMEQRRSLKEQIDALKGQIAAIEADIVARLHGHTVGHAAGWKVTYKLQTTRRLDTKKVAALKLGDEYYTTSESPALRFYAPRG